MFFTDEFVNFQRLAAVNKTFVTTLGMLIFLNLIMLLQVLKANHRIRLLSDTLTKNSSKFVGLFLLLGILHMTFSSFYYLYLGSSQYEYSSFLMSCHSVTALLLGGGAKFKVGVAAGSDNLSRLMMFAYGLIVITIMMNLFISMIVSVIDDAGKELHEHANDPDGTFHPFEHLAHKLRIFARDLILALKDIKMAVGELRKKRADPK